jgi:hypothetical protein
MRPGCQFPDASTGARFPPGVQGLCRDSEGSECYGAVFGMVGRRLSCAPGGVSVALVVLGIGRSVREHGSRQAGVFDGRDSYRSCGTLHRHGASGCSSVTGLPICEQGATEGVVSSAIAAEVIFGWLGAVGVREVWAS